MVVTLPSPVQASSTQSKIVLKLLLFSVLPAPHQPHGALGAAPCWPGARLGAHMQARKAPSDIVRTSARRNPLRRLPAVISLCAPTHCDVTRLSIIPPSFHWCPEPDSQCAR